MLNKIGRISVEELAQAAVIEEFLPKMLTEDEIIAEVSEASLLGANKVCKTWARSWGIYQKTC